MISVFPNITNTKQGITVTPHLIVDSIRGGGKNGKIKSLVSSIRNEPDKKKRNRHKTQLPCIMWSGIFKERNKAGLIKHSGLICLDFDDVDNLQQTKEEICNDKFVYCCFISPSGNGLKVVVKIPEDEKHHIDYFRGLSEHFSWIDIDGGAKDVSRVCYASYDDEIYFNPDSDKWTTKKQAEKNTTGQIPLPSESGGDILPIPDRLNVIKSYIDKQINYVSGQKHDHMKHFTWFANRVGVPEHDCVAFYQQHYDKEDVPKLMANIYKNSANDFNTTPMSANDHDINKPGESKKQYLTFWAIKTSKKGEQSLIFSRQKFITWLRAKGFSRYHYTNSNWALVQHENNIVQKIGKSELKQYVFRYINNLPFNVDGFYRSQIYELMAKGIHSYFSDDLLEILPPLEIETHRDDAYAGYLYFLNGVVRCTTKGVEILDYNDIKGYVWKDQITDRDFVIKDNFENDYRKVLGVVCGCEDDKQSQDVFNQRMAAIESVVGFLLHSYKDPRYCPAIIINDQYINEDNPEGGTGKGIFLNGIRQLKRVVKIDGKLHKMDSNFVFQAIDSDTQIMVFEDAIKGWDFEVLFPVVTEGMTIEKKGKDSFFIDFSKSPKVVVTTNYTIKGHGNSHQRRRFELEFHGYFRDNPPFEYFGHRLFDDWSEDHWQRFDNYMAYCLVRFLRTGLMDAPVVNLNERKLRERTHPDFIDFVRQWLEVGQFTSKQLHMQLNKQNPDFEKYNQSTITRWIKYFMNQTGCEYKVGRISTELGYFRGFTVSKITEKAKKEVVKKVVSHVVTDHKKVVKKDIEENDNNDTPF